MIKNTFKNIISILLVAAMLVTMIPLVPIVTGSEENSDNVAYADSTETNLYSQDELSTPFHLTVVDDSLRIAIVPQGTPDTLELAYSTDNINWYLFQLNTYYTLPKDTTIYFKACPGQQFVNTQSSFSKDPNNYYRFYFNNEDSGKVKAGGNIMSLVQGVNFSSANQLNSNYVFNSLFLECSKLISAPILPATTLSTGCYSYMFYKCSSLIDGPKLPAKNLVTNCYAGMFISCSSLRSIDLGFTQWDTSCSTDGTTFQGATVYWMNGVNSNVSVICPNSLYEQSLSNEIVKANVYQSYLPRYNTIYADLSVSSEQSVPLNFTASNGDMQIGLYSSGDVLSTRPISLEYSYDNSTWEALVLNQKYTVNNGKTIYFRATNRNAAFSKGKKQEGDTADNAYNFLIAGSGNLSANGNIMSLLDKDFKYMRTLSSDNVFIDLFYNCTQLVSAPLLPALNLSVNCYGNMFEKCSGLKDAPELPSKKLSQECYMGMFLNCSSLTDAPALKATVLASECYREMFRGCTALENVYDLPATSLASYCYYCMFYGCESLETAPAIAATSLADYCCIAMFFDCTRLTSAPDLKAKTAKVQCYYSMFANTTSLQNMPEISLETATSWCCYQMFINSGIKSSSECYLVNLAPNCCNEMFKGCTDLISAADLPATTLATSCYENMYSGCSSLVNAPKLPATTLTSSCYRGMFDGCTSLSSIDVSFTDWNTAQDSTSSWVNGVQTIEGTFTCPETLNTESRGANYIPENWDVSNGTADPSIAEGYNLIIDGSKITLVSSSSETYPLPNKVAISYNGTSEEVSKSDAKIEYVYSQDERLNENGKTVRGYVYIIEFVVGDKQYLMKANCQTVDALITIDTTELETAYTSYQDIKNNETDLSEDIASTKLLTVDSQIIEKPFYTSTPDDSILAMYSDALESEDPISSDNFEDQFAVDEFTTALYTYVSDVESKLNATLIELNDDKTVSLTDAANNYADDINVQYASGILSEKPEYAFVLSDNPLDEGVYSFFIDCSIFGVPKHITTYCVVVDTPETETAVCKSVVALIAQAQGKDLPANIESLSLIDLINLGLSLQNNTSGGGEHDPIVPPTPDLTDFVEFNVEGSKISWTSKSGKIVRIAYTNDIKGLTVDKASYIPIQDGETSIEALSKGTNYFKISIKTGTQVKTWYYNVDITAECGSPMVAVYSSAVGLYPRAAEGITSIAYAKVNNDEAFDSVDAMKAAGKDVHYAPVVVSGVTLDKSNFDESWYQFIFDGSSTQSIKLYVK